MQFGQKGYMKNEKEKTLFSILSKECKSGQFSVIEKKDLLFSLSKSFFVEEEDLDELIYSLERQNRIKIKYEDENVYCLSVTQIELPQQKREVSPSFKKSFLFCLLGGFLGGLAGSFFAILIFNL